MDCSICCRWKSSRFSFHCPACARAILYPLRIQHAKTLIEQERIRQQADRNLRDRAKAADHEKEPRSLIENAKHFKHQQVLIDMEESRKQIEQILKQAATLRADVTRARQELEDKKSAIAQRRSDANKGTTGLESRRIALTTDLKKATRRTGLQYEKTNGKIIDARIYLCREVSKLSGLRNKRYKSDNGNFVEEYSISGIPIVDLQDLNKASPAHITSSLTQIARLVILVCGYLDLKVPAEITPPHNDYPLPTIFPPSSSWTSHHVSFPGSTPLSSTHNSPTQSRSFDKRGYPRPRPLFVDRKLQILLREDPAAFGLFVEGATLLAWDIAWLCSVAGVTVEDFSSLGQNLWSLLGYPAKGKAEERPPRLGQLSHGTSHSFLGSSNTPSELKNWGSPMRLVDQVRAGLQADISGAEWEIVDETDFENGEVKGNNGWTKLKSRSGPDV